MKFRLLALLFLLIAISAGAQNNKKGKGFTVEINAPQCGGNTAFLANYWEEQTYALDSVVLSDKGKGTLTINQNVKEGQYLFVIKPDVQIEMLLNKNQGDIKLDIDISNFDACKVTGSNDSKVLWQYTGYVHKVNAELDGMNQELNKEGTSAGRKAELASKINKKQDEVNTYINKLIKKHEKEWSGIFIKGLQPIEIPYPRPTNKAERDKSFQYGKTHFFDNIDLQDPRFWNTGFFPSYIDSYMENWVEETPDSLAAAADRLVAKTVGNKICFKNMLSRFVNNSMKSNVMGRENIWAELAENYIFDREVSWIDSTQLSNLKSEYEKIKNNRIGIKAHNLQLMDFNGRIINTNSIKSDFLLLYFYSPNCGHCKREVPDIYNDIYLKYKGKLEVVAMDINNERPLWDNFIAEHKIHGWINCQDAEYRTQYWMYYNTTSIPAMFLLDKNKKIIARNLDKTNLAKVMEIYMEE